jgi:hypothetical protein
MEHTMDTLPPGTAVAPVAGYAALGVVIKVHAHHPRRDDFQGQPGIRNMMDEVWYLVRWEGGERALVHHSELRRYPVEE